MTWDLSQTIAPRVRSSAVSAERYSTMAYSNKFVMNILLNGEIINDRDSDNLAQIPFGSEYGLRLRNKNDRRASVQIFIDNQNVSGNGYVIAANDKIDLFRHNDRDVAFKFVSLLSEQADDAGKSGPNLDGFKGIIEARFFLEKAAPIQEHHHHHHHYRHPVRSRRITPPQVTPYNPFSPTYPPVINWMYSSGSSAGVTGQSFDLPQLKSFSGNTSCESFNLTSTSDSPAQNAVEPARDLSEGCTVTGGMTGQNFSKVYFNAETNFTSLKIKLMGYDKPIQIVETSSVPSASDHGFCTNCGAKRIPDGAKFCGNCGTKYGS